MILTMAQTLWALVLLIICVLVLINEIAEYVILKSTPVFNPDARYIVFFTLTVVWLISIIWRLLV